MSHNRESPTGESFTRVGVESATEMVREFEAEDGTKYRCEECGQTFEDRDSAESHEDDCFVPPSM